MLYFNYVSPYLTETDEFWVHLTRPSTSDSDFDSRRSGWEWGDGTTFTDDHLWSSDGEPSASETAARMVNGIYKGRIDSAGYRYLCEKDMGEQKSYDNF